jgi:hypothetical protein
VAILANHHWVKLEKYTQKAPAKATTSDPFVSRRQSRYRADNNPIDITIHCQEKPYSAGKKRYPHVVGRKNALQCRVGIPTASADDSTPMEGFSTDKEGELCTCDKVHEAPTSHSSERILRGSPKMIPLGLASEPFT